jgi:hypothetical protein
MFNDAHFVGSIPNLSHLSAATKLPFEALLRWSVAPGSEAVMVGG